MDEEMMMASLRDAIPVCEKCGKPQFSVETLKLYGRLTRWEVARCEVKYCDTHCRCE